jgi:hypothetical protein
MVSVSPDVDREGQTEKRGSCGVVSSHCDRPPPASYPLRRSGLINADAYGRRLETSTQLLRRVEASISVTKPLALAPDGGCRTKQRRRPIFVRST